MKNPVFPDWAPPDAVEFCRELLAYEKIRVSDYPPEIRMYMEYARKKGIQDGALLERLLTSIDMEKSWKKIAAQKINSKFFLMNVLHIKDGPPWPHQYRLTLKEQEKWVMDIQKTAQHLSDLIEFTYFEQYLCPTDLRDKQRKYIENSDYDYDKFANGFLCFTACFSGILRNFSKQAPKIHEQIMSQYHTLKKPSDQSSPKRFFARKLTDFCINQCNKPLRPVVAATTAIVFDDYKIDERIIRRWAPPI